MIKAAVVKVEEMAQSPELSNPLSMFDYLYKEIPPYLSEQREELENHLNKQKKSGKSPQKHAPASSH